MAHKIQFPWKKIQVAIVVKGEQGTGKGIIQFVQKLGAILGEDHFYATQNQESILGRFAPEFIKTNLLTFLDECTFSGDKRQASVLKGLITENMRDYEQKYKDNIKLKNFTDYIIASNYFNIVYVEKNDRRYLCLETSSRYKGKTDKVSKAYFEKIAAVDPRHFAHYLYNMNLDEFDPRAIPSTSFTREQKLSHFSTSIKFLNAVLQNQGISELWTDRDEDTVSFDNCARSSNSNEISKDRFYREYTAYCHSKREQLKYSAVVEKEQFAKAVYQNTGARSRVLRRSHGLPNEHYFVFPDINNSRQVFRDAIQEPDWDFDFDGCEQSKTSKNKHDEGESSGLSLEFRQYQEEKRREQYK